MLLNGGGEGENFSCGLPKKVLPLLKTMKSSKRYDNDFYRFLPWLICLEKWFCFLCPSIGNRPWQSCGGPGAGSSAFVLGMNDNFSQVEFVSPRTVLAVSISNQELSDSCCPPGCGSQAELIVSHPCPTAVSKLHQNFRQRKAKSYRSTRARSFK